MPSCAAPGCSARSDKGEVLKIFPRKDLRRRQVWIDRVNRPGWTPTRYSALCERHFDRDQWELPREDGKRKLKSTAVPSVFCVQHPTEDDFVAKDHAYCILGYRQLYEKEHDYLELDVESDTLPIEHIKVEVDENENLAENVFVEEERESEVDEGEDEDEDVENIQCTPDIFMYPESSEPDPIETVDCHEDDVNAFTSEPTNDPLAISSEDVELANRITPHFSHSTKYLFITKDSKIVPSFPPVVEGEPVVANGPPKLKLLSKPSILIPPPGLHPGSKLLLKSLSSSPPKLTALSNTSGLKKESLPPKLTPISKLILPKGKLLLPKGSSPPKLTSVYKSLKFPFSKRFSPPKLTPISKSLQLSLFKGCSPPKLTPISKSLQFPFPKVCSPPKLTPISKSLKFVLPKSSSPPKLTSISNPLKLSPPKLKLISSSGLSSPLKLRIVSRPLTRKDAVDMSKTINSQQNVNKLTAISKDVLLFPKKKFVAQPTLQKAPQYLQPLPNSEVRPSEEELTSSSQQSGIPHPLPRSRVSVTTSAKTVSSISTPNNNNNAKRLNNVKAKNGQKLKINSFNDSKKLENILLEHQYTKKQSDEGCPLNGTRLLPGKKVTSLTKASSVVVLNPFRKSDTSKSLYANGNKLFQHENLDLFECPICKVAFLSSAYLQTHMTTHGEYVISDEEDEFEEAENTKVIKRPKYSLGTGHYSRLSKTNKRKKNINNGLPTSYYSDENDKVLIPNVSPLKKSKDEEFIRLTNLVSTVNFVEDGIVSNQTAFNPSSVGKVEEDDSETSTESKDLKPKGSVIDETGRRYSLRKKANSTKFRTSSTKVIKKRPKTDTTSTILRKNPVVLLSKVDCNMYSNNKEMKGTQILLSTELFDSDNNIKEWKGWDENSRELPFSGFKNESPAKKSANFGNLKKNSQSKSKNEIRIDSTTKNMSKNKTPSQINKEEDLTGNLSESSQSSSVEEPSSEVSKLSCPVCKLLVEKSKLKSHSLLHVKSEYNCKLCNKKFEKSFQVRRHVTQDHKVVKQFCCLRRDCSRRFESKREMEKHLRSHRK